MKNEPLKAAIKSKGFNIQGLADQIGVKRQAIEKDLNSEKITRKAYVKYEKALGVSYDELFAGEKPTVVDSELVIKLQSEVIYWQRQYIELQKRFFPNAVQLINVY